MNSKSRYEFSKHSGERGIFQLFNPDYQTGMVAAVEAARKIAEAEAKAPRNIITRKYRKE